MGRGTAPNSVEMGSLWHYGGKGGASHWLPSAHKAKHEQTSRLEQVLDIIGLFLSIVVAPRARSLDDTSWRRSCASSPK